MTDEEKKEKLENFHEWITFTDDRVYAWMKELSDDVRSRLDWGVDSLDVLERYILDNYTREALRDERNKAAIDAIASYMGETMRRNLPNGKWRIELDDERNLHFNVPTVTTVPMAGAPISPFGIMLRVFHVNSGGVLRRIFDGTVSVYRDNYGVSDRS
jgi:hypothetical protein